MSIVSLSGVDQSQLSNFTWTLKAGTERKGLGVSHIEMRTQLREACHEPYSLSFLVGYLWLTLLCHVIVGIFICSFSLLLSLFTHFSFPVLL